MRYLSTEQNSTILSEQEDIQFIHNYLIDLLCSVKSIVDGVIMSFIFRVIIILNQ